MDKAVKIFRFDDVSINSNIDTHFQITDFLLGQGFKVMWGISPLVHDMSNEGSQVAKERVFPEIINAYSDNRKHYNVKRAGIPMIHSGVMIAGHGLIHCDHRFLNYQAQEMSILISCNLVGARMFIPPFNKWNKDTEEICEEHHISLIKFEEGWKSMEFNDYSPSFNFWYLHARAWTLEGVKNWLSKWNTL
jgi:hypothetical protein